MVEVEKLKCKNCEKHERAWALLWKGTDRKPRVVSWWKNEHFPKLARIGFNTCWHWDKYRRTIEFSFHVGFGMLCVNLGWYI